MYVCACVCVCVCVCACACVCMCVFVRGEGGQSAVVCIGQPQGRVGDY